ncbi:MAG TPA: diguanylate cyclase [Pseudomonas sp.]|uniref:bifunctional diguanylate cyclase/phosphodiesterase n=1 Tax=Pseudomonas sp. TaxID=306 RepID=UPI002B4A7A3E|nr:diguanylate cyclase [Pseudomonas sp.]HKS12782.1 diguanylate cyclase [Pseudomonas sp.]
MQIAPPPLNEAARLCFLASLNILDTPPEESFDRITRLTRTLLGVPIALVSLVDLNRQWFKSCQGLDVAETSRDIAFCAHALHVDEALVIPDAEADPRFADNPLVTGTPHIRFYAGVPLRFADGLTVGTLCALDTGPRALTDEQLHSLRDLARIVERELMQRSLAIDARVVEQAQRRAKTSSEAQFRAVFRETPSGEAILDLDGRFLEVNREFCKISGYNPEELVLTTAQQIILPADLDTAPALLRELIDGQRKHYTLEGRLVTRQGGQTWVETSIAVIRDDAGAPRNLVAQVRDISERKRSQLLLEDYQARLEHQVAERTHALLRSQETLQAIADNLPVLVSHIGPDLKYRFNNAVYKDIFGVDPSYLQGKRVADVLPHEVYEQLLPFFQQALQGHRVEADDIRYSPTDSRIWRASYVPDVRHGKVEGFFVMSLDVTERKNTEKALVDRASIDALTGLPNRTVLQRELARLLDRQNAFALFFIDLDGFKSVNDQWGHETGDLLLQAAARRMLGVVRAEDLVIRLAGDEFVVLALSEVSEAAAQSIGLKLCDTLSSPFQLSGHDVKIGASIGIVIYREQGGTVTPEDVLGRADHAMYEAKRKGRNHYRIAEGYG